MGFNYNFRYPGDMTDIRQLETYLLQYPRGYPYYEDWVVDKAIPEIESGYKKAILAFSNGFLVGDLILQPHKDFPTLLEFKNMVVHPKNRGRDCGAFMFRNGEVEAREENYDAIICDLRSDNIPMLNLLKFMGYEELLKVSLYEEGVEDIVMVRRFERTPSGLFAPIKQKIIANAA